MTKQEAKAIFPGNFSWELAMEQIYEELGYEVVDRNIPEEEWEKIIKREQKDPLPIEAKPTDPLRIDDLPSFSQLKNFFKKVNGEENGHK